MKRLIKFLMFKPDGDGFHTVLLGAGRGIKIHVDPGNQTQRLLGLAELEIANEFVNLALRSKTFCDVGASDSWYCLLALKHNPNLRVVAIEADPQFFKTARENMMVNGCAELDRVKWIIDFCGTKATTLDMALRGFPAPIFVKIDIEGAEMDALKSAEQTLRESVCALIVETHSYVLERECAEWLGKLGYTVRVVEKGIYRKLIPEQRPLPHNQWLIATRSST